MKVLSWKFLLFVLLVLGIGFVLYGYFSSRVEQPKYRTLSRQKNIELREYPQLIVAQVSVTGERDKAANEAFRMLADYIFGNNSVQAKISMTAPVTQQNQKIAMTAPVMQQASGDKSWTVRFVMPSEYTMETLPKPNNDAVKILAVPARKKVVIQFSGYWKKGNLTQHLDQLKEYIKKQNLSVQGEPEYAFYNPPWTIGFMRTNEISFQLGN